MIACFYLNSKPKIVELRSNTHMHSEKSFLNPSFFLNSQIYQMAKSLLNEEIY